jgi:hypothetical protein
LANRIDAVDIDGARGAVIDRLDTSRRVYLRLFGALHKLDWPMLRAHPAVRSTIIVAFCGCGFVFSMSGCVIAWRRLRRTLIDSASGVPSEQ